MNTTINVNPQNAAAAYRQTQTAANKPTEQISDTTMVRNNRTSGDTIEISPDGKAYISRTMEKSTADKINMNTDESGGNREPSHFTAFADEFSKAAQKYIDIAQMYYCEAHNENLKFNNPAEHIWNKYKNTESEYFRSDLTELERAWSYDSEIDMLSDGNRLQMNNPFVFGEDMPSLSDIAIQANKECRAQIESAVNELFSENGISIPEDTSIRLTVNRDNYKISVSGLDDEELSENIEHMLNSGNNGKNLYEHINLCNPAIFGFDAPKQYTGTNLGIEYSNGYLNDIGTEYGYGKEQTGWENSVQEDKCDLIVIKDAAGDLCTRFSGTYDPQSGKLLSNNIISLKPSAEMTREKTDRIGANIRLSMPSLREQMRQYAKQHEYKADPYNDADPDGSIFNRVYFTAYIGKLQEAVEHIENYYSKAHEENSRYTGTDGLLYLWSKYKDSNSAVFRSDMGAAERETAYYQEKALYLGGNVTLADKYALADFGGLINSGALDKSARKAAYDYLESMMLRKSF